MRVSLLNKGDCCDTVFVFDVAGMSSFPNDSYTQEQIVAFCNNKFASRIVNVLNPTLIPSLSECYLRYLHPAIAVANKEIELVNWVEENIPTVNDKKAGYE